MRLARHVTTLLVAAVCQLACLGGADLEIDVASDEPLIVAEGDDECTVCRANAAAPGCGGTSDPNLIVCDGPWRFQQFKSCPRVHPECGCARWNQVRDRQCGATTRDRTQHATVVGQRVEQTCLNGPPGPGCEEPGPSVFFPNRAAARDACRALHDDWVAQDEQTFDTHPSLDFRWESVGSSVPSSPIQPGPSNGTGYTWQCSSTRNFSTANICTADKCEATGACGECQEVASCYRYDSDCGIDSIQYAHMGTSRSELVEAQCAAADQSSACESSFLSRECTTADDILDPNAKVEALDENLNLGFPLAAREIDPDIYRKVYQRVQLTYEFFGLDLSEANRRRARHVYSIDGWPEALDCGNSPSPAALGRCPETDPLLVFCARMTSDHVNPDFVWRGKHGDGHPGIGNFCYRLLESYDSEQCANNVTINEAWEVQQALLDKMGDQFEAHFATDVCVVDAPEEKRDLRTAASSLYLWHITDWYYANLPFSSTERADDELMRAMGDFWRHVDGAMELNKAIEDGLVCGEDDDGVGAITASFDRAIERAFEANQDILRAAMIQYNGAPPDVIRGMPLVAVFGQISQSFIDRLEAQRATHDLGCRFGGCRSVAANGDISVTQTRISYLYQLLAMIDDVPGLSGALAQPSIDSDWIPAFQVVSENHSKLISALQEILGTDTLETADVSALRRPGQALISGLNRAKSRHNAYSETGELVVGTGRYQQAPLDQARRDGVIAVLQTAVDGLNTELDQFDVAVGRLITQLVDEAQSGAAVERLRERRLQLAKEIDRVDAKRNAHARAAVGENAADQVARALVEAEGRLEAEGQVNSYLTVERRGPIYLAGNDALWSGDGRPNLIGDITGGSEVVSAGRGELITVNVTAGSRWSPSCALSDLGLNAPSTGPSGYTVVDNDGVFEASSTTEAAEDSWGVSVSACVGGGFVLSAQVCVNRAFQKSRTKTETQGSERRTSAQFESGFYDGSTPLHAPVGSLLLVEMPEGVYDLDEIRDVHLIREPSTTIVPSAADGGVPRSEFYFVVNDNVSSCPGGEPNSDQALEVHVARLQGALPYGTRAIGAMAEIIEYMREQEAQLVEQGFILPGQLEDIHNTARAQLDPTERRRTDFPSALIDIIDAIATREKVRLEHAVRLAALDEERERLVDQGNLLLIEIEATTATARLHELAPRWSLHNLDLDVNPSNPGQNGLYSATNEITEVLADFVFPIVELWHRDLHLSLATHSRITALQNPSPSASLYRRAVAVRDLSEHLIDELGSLGQPASGVSTVAFSFRRPPVPTNPLLGGEGGDYTSFHHADPGRGNAVWDSIDAAIDSPTGVGRVSFSVRPEDIYLGDGGLFRLSCSDANPLIRRIGLAVVSSSQVLGVQDGVPAPYVGLGVEIDASPEQLIATFAGPVLYGNHVESGPPTMSNVPAVPAEDADSDANANAINMVELAWARPDVEPIGRSPFADFSFNFNAVFGHLTIFDEFAEQGTELVVVMEVEHTSAALGEQPNRLDWVPTCQIENSSAACMDGYDNDRDGEIDCADAGCAQHCP